MAELEERNTKKCGINMENYLTPVDEIVFFVGASDKDLCETTGEKKIMKMLMKIHIYWILYGQPMKHFNLIKPLRTFFFQVFHP